MTESIAPKMRITAISDTVWSIEDDAAMMYLIAGTESALLLDTGLGLLDLPAVCRSLTPLPVRVLLTHAHGDHALGAGH